MPTGIYKRSEKQIAMLKEYNNNKVVSEETRRKISTFNKGKKLSAEHKQKIGIANNGNKRPDLSLRNKQGIWKGKIHTLESRRKISEANRGEKCYNWQGGKTKINNALRQTFEYKLWRKSVFERDNWTCIWCGIRGGKINADHIKPFALYPELRFAIDNGRTLCVPCHKTTDTYGVKLMNKKTFKLKIV